MASKRQVEAAKRNVKKAQAAASSKGTIARLSETSRRRPRDARKRARRGGRAGHAVEDRNRRQLYEMAKERDIPGRSKMGKWELVKALRG